MGRITEAIYRIANREQSKKIQNKVQKKREQGSDKTFRELIDEELQKECSIEPIKEE